MKKIFPFCCILFCGYGLRAQDIVGTWNGNISVQGNSIPIVFHIGKDSTGNLMANFDSPSQNAYAIACNAIEIEADSVIMSMKTINGRYTGKLSSDHTQMAGTWHQGNASIALDMEKTSEVAGIKERRRPQTPKPPFPYTSLDVEYDNAPKTIHYGATFTVPFPDANPNFRKSVYPTVILITGSGQQDRDETIMDHKSFAVIADKLTRQGIAVLRVDDRGIGKTTGNFFTSTTADFIKDVEAGLDYLKTRKDVDTGMIGLIGHSEGGMIAPVVATERSEVKFIVLLAGPGIPIIDLMALQQEAVTLSLKKTPEVARAGAELFRRIARETISTKGKDIDKTISIINEWAKQTDKSVVAEFGLSDTASRRKYAVGEVAAFNTPWFRYFLAFDPQPYLEKLSCKVLALNGGRDIQVLAQANLAGIRSSLAKSKSPRYDVVELPGLNHLFQHCTTCTVEEYGDLEETFSPDALQFMSDWIKEVTTP